MNTPNNSELFRLASLIGCEPEDEERHRKQLLEYINNQIIEARIDEMQHSLEHIPMRIGELVDYKNERLTQLRTTK